MATENERTRFDSFLDYLGEPRNIGFVAVALAVFSVGLALTGFISHGLGDALFVATGGVVAKFICTHKIGPRPKVFWSIVSVSVALFIAGYDFFIRWPSEHTEAKPTKNTAAQAIDPMFDGSKHSLIEPGFAKFFNGTATSPKSIKGAQIGIALVSFKNRGLDSVFDNWRITVTAPGTTEEIPCQFVRFPLRSLKLDGTSDPKLNDSDALERKTFPNPVRRGAGVTGFLLFHPTTKDRLNFGRGWIIHIYFNDAYGINFRLETMLYAPSDSSDYYPGISTTR